MATKKKSTPSQTPIKTSGYYPTSGGSTTPGTQFRVSNMSPQTQDNIAARKSTEAYASPFSTAFGGKAPSTTLDFVRQYASPFSTAFGGTAPARPYSPSLLVEPSLSGPGKDTGSPSFIEEQDNKDDGNGNNGNNGNGNNNGNINKIITTARALLEAALRAEGIPEDLIQPSVAFLEALDNDGIDDVNDMVNIYFNNKNFTTKAGVTLESPFYKRYTSLGEGVTNPATGRPYTGREMFAWRTGIESKVDQYGLSPLFKSDDTLRKLAKSGRSVQSFAELAETAILAEKEADPFKVAALRKMNYIGPTGGLRDFYLNPEIGTQQLEENRRSGAIATEALRYAERGILFDEARIKQIGAAYGSITESAAQQKAAALYQTVGESLQPMTSLAGIYERPTQTTGEMAPGIQRELEDETLYAMPSERRKRLAGLNTAEFQRQAGTLTDAGGIISLRGRGTTGLV